MLTVNRDDLKLLSDKARKVLESHQDLDQLLADCPPPPEMGIVSEDDMKRAMLEHVWAKVSAGPMPKN